MRRSILLILLMLGGCASGGVADREAEPNSYYRKGLELYARGDRKAAVSEMDKALEAEPGLLRIRFDRARILMEIGMREDLEALRLSQDAKLLRKDRNFKRAREKEQQANEAHKKARPYLERARDQFLRVREAQPEEANVAFFLGRIYAVLEENEKAVEFFQEAYELGQPVGHFRKRLGLAIEHTEEAIYRKETEQE